MKRVKALYKKNAEFKAEDEQTYKKRGNLCGLAIEAIDAWHKAQCCLPKSAVGSTLAYVNDNWESLTRYLKDPELPLDNNPAERALRQLVLSKKNFLFNRSMHGASVAEILHSICVSCELCRADPKHYLKETILRIPNCRGFQLPYALVNQ